ncbi:MAG TPA: polymer-forming cytoskeletal protein [Verrucomicrobiae bacterium]|nr:polymer-forming cytoskeletal protein [Verrucomicrobiae bacterium]
MAPKKQARVLLTCPHCGHQQNEPPTAFSTICKGCGRHLRVQEILNPAPKEARRAHDVRQVACFECGTELEVPVGAESTMCKRCGRYVDLHDYHITSSVAKNFKTKGALVVEPKGCVFNTESVAGDVVIKGRFHGKLKAQSLTIHSGADLKGVLTAEHLVIPAENHFRLKDMLRIGSAEIAGELVGDLQATQTVILKSTARMYGNVEAAGIVVESGAVFVGHARAGLAPAPKPS